MLWPGSARSVNGPGSIPDSPGPKRSRSFYGLGEITIDLRSCTANGVWCTESGDHQNWQTEQINLAHHRDLLIACIMHSTGRIPNSREHTAYLTRQPRAPPRAAKISTQCTVMLVLCIFPFGKIGGQQDMLKGMSSLKVLTPLFIPQQHLATLLYLCQGDNSYRQPV